MHPEQIKAAIRMKGTTPAAIADELGVSRSMVSHVITGKAKSDRIARHIAKVTSLTLEAMWPAVKPKASLRRSKPATSARTVAA